MTQTPNSQIKTLEYEQWISKVKELIYAIERIPLKGPKLVNKIPHKDADVIITKNQIEVIQLVKLNGIGIGVSYQYSIRNGITLKKIKFSFLKLKSLPYQLLTQAVYEVAPEKGYTCEEDNLGIICTKVFDKKLFG